MINEYVELGISEEENLQESYFGPTNLQHLISVPSVPKRLEILKKLLEDNPILLTKKINSRHRRHRPLLSFIKYDIKENTLLEKQQLIQLVIDVGHKYFLTDFNNKKINFRVVFYTAANGYLSKLDELIDFFIKKNQIHLLHNTIDGDNLISFVIKYGNYKKQLKNIVRLILDRIGIDCYRVDYENCDIKTIIEKEKNNYAKQGLTGKVEELEEIVKMIDTSNKDNTFSLEGNRKIKLFNEIIKDEYKASNILHQDVINENDGENTLLQLAIIKNQIKTVQKLLRFGISPNRTVQDGNEEHPLVFASVLYRKSIFRELLKTKRINFTPDILSKLTDKYFNIVLESDCLDPNMVHAEHSLLYHAIRLHNSKAVSTLLSRGAKLTKDCLKNINPSDLEEYFSSCIKFDNYKRDVNEHSCTVHVNFDCFLNNRRLNGKFPSEIYVLKKLSKHQRLSYLIEHPLVQLLMLLKWECVKYSYYMFSLIKILFYVLIALYLYYNHFSIIHFLPLICIQFFVFITSIPKNITRGKITLQFMLEAILLLFLILVCSLTNTDIFKKLSSVITVLMSVSVVLTIGSHPYFAKFAIMIKNVFSSFVTVQPVSTVPAVMLSAALRNALNNSTATDEDDSRENSGSEEYSSRDKCSAFVESLSRVLPLLNNNSGTKDSPGILGGYEHVIFFMLGISLLIVVMNFWTGVAVSNVGEVEEQAFVAVFSNVNVYIQSVERIYNSFNSVLWRYCPKIEHWFFRIQPFLALKINLDPDEKPTKLVKYNPQYSIVLQINKRRPFESISEFRSLKMEEELKRAIKNLTVVDTTDIMKDVLSKLDQNIKTQNLIKDLKSRIEKLEKLVKSQNINTDENI